MGGEGARGQVEGIFPSRLIKCELGLVALTLWGMDGTYFSTSLLPWCLLWIRGGFLYLSYECCASLEPPCHVPANAW